MPEMTPVEAFKLRPVGKLGEIEPRTKEVGDPPIKAGAHVPVSPTIGVENTP